jgi:C-terminal processing protease CtpA/Prc
MRLVISARRCRTLIAAGVILGGRGRLSRRRVTPLVNSVGQTYQGPVVLITDAQCYSACDIFAAGFQDDEIGPVLGVEANTGAAGANVVTHEELRTEWTDGGLKKLPKGVQMRVALRRCLRVGTRMGQPGEDLGVVPDALHEITKRDLLEENADLMAAAGALLAQRQSRLLRFTTTAAGAKKRKLTITTGSITSIDAYVNARPSRPPPPTTGPPRSPSPPPPATSSASKVTTPQAS